MCPRRKMLDIKGFSEIKVDKIKEAALKCTPGVSGFITAFELRENRRNIFTISTGCKAFDTMLGGYVSNPVW
jgi:meiotic recombination protein DMC1